MNTFGAQLLFSFLLFIHTAISQSNYLDDKCQMARTGETGICRFLKDCPTAIKEILDSSLFPTTCEFVNKEEVVCCAEIRKPKPQLLSSRISQKKCAQYQNAIYQRVYVNGGGFNRPSEKQDIFQCPHSNVPLIVGGSIAREKEFPHMVLIGYNVSNQMQYSCAGSLISERFVLTAAHCVSNQKSLAETVLLGCLTRNSKSINEHSFISDIILRIRHPNYKIPSKYNDIALLKLSKEVQFNLFIRPACLDDSVVASTEHAIATGWGRTEYQAKQSDILLKVILDWIPFDECNGLYRRFSSRYLTNGIDLKTQICAGSKKHRRDTCQGDSGGPLQIYHPQIECMYSIVGITSFGVGCGEMIIPGVYTRVSAFIDWIEHIVWPIKELNNI